jgi:glycosyltransferase involved in cell wall biosynthesis
MYKASIIISFYKKIDFLKPVLDSLILQSEKNFEVIISDDGSHDEVVKQVKSMLSRSNLNFQYVWHEDKGWRKNIILNKSVVHSKSNFLIFIDGDCILHHRFVEEHVKMASRGIVRAGRRVNLSSGVSRKIIEGNTPRKYYENLILLDLLLDSIRKKARDVEQGIYIRSRWIRAYLNDKDRSIKGCNFSIYKQDLLAVNGYDERFDRPSLGEDTDLEARLRRNGVEFLGIRNQAIQYHLYHKQLSREDNNTDIYNDNNKNGVTYTRYGIQKEDVPK